ncbi:glycosyltransferase family 4 protein [Chryseobacterium sp. KACC 21268]|nr:glycosyltransferase family 4 protein [Chryseobacterium sp. KACC 21268]
MAKLFRITTVPISVEKLLGRQLTFMNQYFEVTAISADKEYLDRVGTELGIKTYSIEMTRKITPLQDLKSLWQMYQYIKKEKPEIVHTHTPKAGLIGMMAAKLAGVKIRLHTVAGLPLMEATGLKRKVLNHVEKFTYNCATNVYPNSKGLYDFIIIEKLGKPEKLQVIGNGSTNGIDVSQFDPALFSKDAKNRLRKDLKIGENDFVFVFVGRLVKDKGMNELILAFKNLQGSNSQTLKLLLVGPLEQELDPLSQETLDEIENNDAIVSVGFQKDVRPYFALSNCLVFPSYREGFPNVVLQALAMGLPALVSDINGCNEIVTDGKNGLIFPPKNTGAVRAAMQKMTNYPLYTELQEAARSSIGPYRQQLIWELLKDNYNSLLDSQHSSFSSDKN